MADEIKDAKPEEITPPVEPSATEGKPETTPPAEGDKTEKVEEGKQVAKEAEPWHKDPRFKEFLEKKKELEEKAETMGDIEKDPDFATFLAFKRQKEAMAQAEKKVDFSRMSAEEYAEYVANNAKEVARKEYRTLVEANKTGDELSREAVGFAEKVGVTKDMFQKEYAPKIMEHYAKVAKKIGEDKMDSFVMANPPLEVFKSLHFEKASEAGVYKYKQEIENAKKANFESETAGKTVAPESIFEENWKKLFGNANELPLSAFDRK